MHLVSERVRKLERHSIAIEYVMSRSRLVCWQIDRTRYAFQLSLPRFNQSVAGGAVNKLFLPVDEGKKIRIRDRQSQVAVAQRAAFDLRDRDLVAREIANEIALRLGPSERQLRRILAVRMAI